MISDTLVAALSMVALASSALAQPCGVPIVFQPLPGITGFHVAMDFDPTDPTRLIALDIYGPVRSYNTTTGAVTTILTLSDSANGNGGYGLAIDPLYATTGHVYIFFPTSPTSSLLRFTRSGSNPALLDPASRTVILQVPHPPTQHTGGWIGFGPDGFLYVGLGDHGDFTNGQNNSVLMGKLLRIDIRSDDFPADPNKNYAIPPTNPFIGTGTPPEVVCRGLRNPYRNAFDPLTGALYIADVGAGSYEEVDRIFPTSGLGQNFGWYCREGFAVSLHGCIPNPPTFTNPIIDFDHSRLICITGGIVYRGSSIPGLAGRYLVGSCSGPNVLYSFDPSKPISSLRLHAGGQLAFCFAASPQGEIFAGLSNGIARIIPAAPPLHDCNANGIPDDCEIAGGLETDFNANGIPDSCERACPADFNVSGTLNTQDIINFIARWFLGQLAADFNHSGDLSTQDIFDFLNAWFTGCP